MATFAALSKSLDGAIATLQTKQTAREAAQAALIAANADYETALNAVYGLQDEFQAALTAQVPARTGSRVRAA